MDDIRTSIIQGGMQALKGNADDNTINLVQDVPVIQLKRYEVQERCTGNPKISITVALSPRKAPFGHAKSP